MCSLVQVKLCVYCLVAGDELTVNVFRDLPLQVIFSVGIENDSCTLNLLATTVYTEVQWNVYEHSQ